MKAYSVEQTQEKLEELLEHIEATGEEIVITQGGEPVAVMKKHEESVTEE